MSAIAALFHRDGAPVADATLAAMLDGLRHRGPDTSARWIEGDVGLAHALLETSGTDGTAAQPLCDPRSRCVIVADARLDNRAELLDALALSPLRGRERADAEVLLAAYLRWGEDCPRHLLGDFAFVVWDGARRQLFCARDHLGVRPLYYHLGATVLRCSSEPQPLFAGAAFAPRAHRLSLGLFLADEYSERDQTLYDGIFALPPAHTMVVSPASMRLDAYWAPEPGRTLRHRSDEAYAEHFRAVLTEAVRCRMRASGAIAAHVSGGLDSSAVAGIAESLRRSTSCAEPLMLLSAAFPGLPCDEASFSRAVGEHWGLPVTTISALGDPDLCAPDVARLHPDIYYNPTVLMLDPLLDPLRARRIRTVLTGLGADQLLYQTGLECADELRGGRLAAAARAAGITRRPLSRGAWRRLGLGLRRALPGSVRSFVRALRRRRSEPQLPCWLAPAVARDVSQHHAERGRLHAGHPYPGLVARELGAMLAQGRELVLPLVLADRAAARHAVEYRHPFLDRRVVDVALDIPNDQRCQGDLSKPVLRRAMSGLLPPAVRARRSTAEFTSYVERALWSGHSAAVRSLFKASRLEEIGIIDGASVRRLLDDPTRDVNEIATLTSLELWLRQSIPS